MKFIHTADWHLGYRQYGMLARESDFLKPLDEIRDIAVRERAECVMVSGDIFDSYRPPASAVQAARRFGDSLARLGIRVFTIDGNHDPSSGKWSRLCGFTPLEQDTLDGTPQVNVAGTWFAGIDFCRSQQLVDKLKSLKDRGCDLHGGVLALHMEISDLTAYSTAVSIGDLEPYLDALNVGYVALGHIHNAIAHTTETGRIYRYPGSTEVNDISELGPKGVDVVTVDATGRYSYESLTLNTRKFDIVNVDSQDTVDDRIRTVLSEPDTFWLVKIDLSAPGKLSSRVSDALKDAMYRPIPYGNRSIEQQTEKKTVVVGLKDAIGVFFEADSDEASLVSRMIDTPEHVKAIAAEYVNPSEQEGKCQ